MYYETLIELGLRDDPKLRKLYNSGLDEAIRMLNMEINALRRHRGLSHDFEYKNVLAAEELGLEKAITAIEDRKCFI